MKKRNTALRYGSSLLLLAASPAFALDTTGLVTDVKKTTVSTDAVGLAILGVVVAIAVIGWIRRVIR